MKLKRSEQIFFVVLILMAMSGIAWALSSEKITVSNTPIGLTVAKYEGAARAQLAVESYGIRWTCDPTITLTTTLGIPADAGSYIWLDTPAKIQKFKALRSSGNDATLQVEYFKAGE